MTSHSRQLLLSYNLPRNGFLTSTRAFKRYQPVKHNKLQMMKMSFRPLMLLYLFYLEIRGSLVTLAYTSGKRLWRLLGRDGAGATKFQQLFHLTSMMLRPLQRPQSNSQRNTPLGKWPFLKYFTHSVITSANPHACLCSRIGKYNALTVTTNLLTVCCNSITKMKGLNSLQLKKHCLQLATLFKFIGIALFTCRHLSSESSPRNQLC